jgi:hypothetical protein
MSQLNIIEKLGHLLCLLNTFFRQWRIAPTLNFSPYIKQGLTMAHQVEIFLHIYTQ